MKDFNYYLKIWWMMSKNSFLSVLSQKKVLLIFLIGKLIRFILFFSFLYFLIRESGTLAGYTLHQSLFFFLTFNVIDILAQFFFRGVYTFRGQVVSGSFDITLSKPASSLFRALFGGADVIDLVTIPPLFIAIYLVGRSLEPSFSQIILYVLLILNGLVIAAAFHIAVLAFGIITLEIDHLIMIYRDLVNLGRFPVGIYREPLRGILTYIVPVAIMVAVPAQALMGLMSFQGVLISLLLGAGSFFIALKFWKFSLRYYTSASS